MEMHEHSVARNEFVQQGKALRLIELTVNQNQMPPVAFHGVNWRKVSMD